MRSNSRHGSRRFRASSIVSRSYSTSGAIGASARGSSIVCPGNDTDSFGDKYYVPRYMKPWVIENMVHRQQWGHEVLRHGCKNRPVRNRENDDHIGACLYSIISGLQGSNPTTSAFTGSQGRLLVLASLPLDMPAHVTCQEVASLFTMRASTSAWPAADAQLQRQRTR
jgi:hypothetical protein